MVTRLLIAGILAAFTSGCALHNVGYNAFVKNKIEPVDHATVVHGVVDESKRLTEQAQLPHNTPRQRYELEREAGKLLRAQLGSQDYLVIGEVYGGGNAYSTLETLKAVFAKKAATRGGDVILIFSSGVEERPFVYSTPGHARTNVYGSAYSYGNYASGQATAYTTYTPGQTYAGVMRFPRANGLVLKYVPGIELKREAISLLADPDLERVLRELDALRADDSITLEEAVWRWGELTGQRDTDSKRGSAPNGAQPQGAPHGERP